jgi:hypothetical protein
LEQGGALDVRAAHAPDRIHFPCWFSKAHAGATAVLVDELDAGGFRPGL